MATSLLKLDERFSFPAQAALAYAFLWLVWILAWDRLIAAAPVDERVLVMTRRALYVGTMALLIWWVIRRQIRRAEGLAARFEAIAEQQVVGVYIARANRLVYVNDALSRMLGFDRKDLLSRPATDFLDPVDAERACVPGWGSDEAEPYRRFLARRADGEIVPVHVARRPVELEDGSAWAGVVLDASRTEALEGQLLRSAQAVVADAAARGTASLETEDAPALVVAGPRPGWRAGHTVLVVDDEPAVRRVIVAALRRQGYRVLEAGEGQSALKQFMSDQKSIDLVLCDFELPGERGPDLVQKMLEQRPDLKVMFVTGYPTKELIASDPALERFPFIEKPFSVDDLTLSVDRMWGLAPSA